MNIKKKIQPYLLVFVATLCIIRFLRWVTGYTEDGNLLVNGVAALIVTAVVAAVVAGLRALRRRR